MIDWKKLDWARIASAFTSMLTFLAGLSYAIGDAALLIPPGLKSIVFQISLFATVVLRVWSELRKAIEPKPEEPTKV